uniref:Class I SAM-dependent methyltransferase n=1 Tax=Thermodesulfovibrio aggregans TaxID=86166 RepID=A0A7C4AJR2_9BACT
MDELAKEYIIDFFTKRLIHFKDSPEAVGWTASGQMLRYEAVLKFINPSEKSILDFGCGKGDFYKFLKEKGIKCKYTGIDINPSLIELAKKNYPETVFYVKDIEMELLDEFFDYTIAIGVFNLAVQGVKASMEKCLEILFNRTSEKLIFTCLNKKTKLKDISVNYFSAEELEKIAKTLTRKYQIMDSFVEGDLFLILSKS